jgi:hypothetical protein
MRTSNAMPVAAHWSHVVLFVRRETLMNDSLYLRTLLAKTLPSLTCLAALAACGGGGGGDSGPGPSPAPPATDVRFVNVSVPSITNEVFEGSTGDPLLPWSVTADAAGNLTTLTGQTLFVVLEDPDGFVDRVLIPSTLQSTGNRLTISPKSSNPLPGVYTGPFRISVCLDANCATRLGGTPVVVPYRITVLQGPRATLNDPSIIRSTASTAVRVPFQVTLPALVTSWTAEVSTGSAMPTPFLLESDPTSPTSFVLVAPAAPVGTYVATVIIRASASKPSGGGAFVSRNYTVNYEVR